MAGCYLSRCQAQEQGSWGGKTNKVWMVKEFRKSHSYKESSQAVESTSKDEESCAALKKELDKSLMFEGRSTNGKRGVDYVGQILLGLVKVLKIKTHRAIWTKHQKCQKNSLFSQLFLSPVPSGKLE